MRKVILSEALTLDGYFAGPHGEFDWPLADEEFERYTNDETFSNVDTILFGRVTYEMMASYWPEALTNSSGRMAGADGVEFAVPTAVSNTHNEIARKMNSLQKIVFSRTLEKVEWRNSTIIREIIPEDIKKIKSQGGGDMIILGSGSVASEFAKNNLIDDYRLFVNPIVLGEGRKLFAWQNSRLKLDLVGTKAFKSGAVELRFASKH